MFYTLIKTQVFDQSECAQGPIYILISDKARCFSQSERALYGNFIVKLCTLDNFGAQEFVSE